MSKAKASAQRAEVKQMVETIEAKKSHAVPRQRLTERTAPELEAGYASGDITLFEALHDHMMLGMPIPMALADAFVEAVDAYVAGEVDDIAKPFGVWIPPTARKDTAQFVQRVKLAYLVRQYQRAGYPLESSKRKTAFEMVAEQLGMSPSTVAAKYKGKRK